MDRAHNSNYEPCRRSLGRAKSEAEALPHQSCKEAVLQNRFCPQRLVEGTRIGVHDVVGLILNGASVHDVCRSFPERDLAEDLRADGYTVTGGT
jgi:Protein of unknown function (DUF433)